MGIKSTSLQMVIALVFAMLSPLVLAQGGEKLSDMLGNFLGDGVTGIGMFAVFVKYLGYFVFAVTIIAIIHEHKTRKENADCGTLYIVAVVSICLALSLQFFQAGTNTATDGNGIKDLKVNESVFD